jgi:hypothetical protein
VKLAPLLLFCVAGPALAQTRPFLTEQAATARAGSLVLELGGDVIGGEPNFRTGHRRTRWDGPVLRLVYSPADTVEIDVEWTAGVWASNDPDFGSVADWGDVALRAKVRFIEEKSRRPALAARFGVVLPDTDADQGLGPNTMRMAAQLLLSKSAAGFELHANAGLAIQDQVTLSGYQDDFLAYGLGLLRAAGRRVTLGAEVAGLAGRGTPGTDARHEARFGLRYTRGAVRWDAALRRGLGAADGYWGVSAGLACTLRQR